jgi:hypothetical protein
MKNTPGPWTLSRLKSGGGEPSFRIDGDPTLLLFVSACSDGFVIGQNEANANLIATAPDLLAELQSSVEMMVNALDNMAYLFPAKTPEAQAWRDMLKTKVREARAVIAKATGGKE